MADEKLTDQTANATLADGDFVYVVDVSDTTDDAAGTGYKVLLSTLQAYAQLGLTASNISDFDTEVSNNSSVTANTAKVSNATHTGDVTGSTALTIAAGAVDEAMCNVSINASLDLADSSLQSGDAITVLDGTAHRVIYIDGSGNVTELALGADGTFLKSNGATSAPSFATPAGSGDALTSNGLDQFAATTSAELAGVISNETGSGALVFGTSPTLVTPALGTPSAVVLTNATGTAAGLTVGATTGVEAGADVTDTANVTSAGALMDSELTSIADVKALDQSVVSGATPTFTTTNFTDATNKRLLTDAQETLVDNSMQNLVDDTSPQLGGELDMQANSIGGTVQTATGDGTTTIDWGNGNMFDFTFGAFNETFTFTAPTKPGTFILRLLQDSVGSRTATWPATVKWPGGTAPTLTTTATTGTDVITFYYNGTNYYAVSSLDFS